MKCVRAMTLCNVYVGGLLLFLRIASVFIPSRTR